MSSDHTISHSPTSICICQILKVYDRNGARFHTGDLDLALKSNVFYAGLSPQASFIQPVYYNAPPHHWPLYQLLVTWHIETTLSVGHFYNRNQRSLNGDLDYTISQNDSTWSYYCCQMELVYLTNPLDGGSQFAWFPIWCSSLVVSSRSRSHIWTPIEANL